MMTPRCDLARSVALAIAVLLSGHSAWAQPTDADVAYEDGRRLYDLREWDQAIAKFKEAYRLRPDPKSLFNIAQSFRLKNDCVEAINFYRTYKRNFPNEKNVPKVDKFIAELEPCAKLSTNPPPPPLVKTDPVRTEPVKPYPDPLVTTPVRPQPRIRPDPQPQPQLPPPVERPTVVGKNQRTAGIVIASIGALGLIGGVYFGLDAQSLANDATNGMQVWDPTLEERGKSADSKAKLLFGIGGAAVIGGIIIYAVAPRAERSPVGVVPYRDGAMVVWTGKL